MEIANQLESIVNALITEIKTKLDAELQETIATHIDKSLAEFDFDSKVEAIASPKLDKKIADYTIDTNKVNSELTKLGETTIANLKDHIAKTVEASAKQYLADYDVTPVINAALKSYLTKFNFPVGSINFAALNLDNATISGDYINGGIINNFSSTGIDDKATSCQVTILDTHVVVEQPILTTGAQIKGNAIVEGTLTVSDLAGDGADKIIVAANDKVFARLLEQGVVAPKLVWNEKTLIDESSLAPSIVTSNLRKVGTLAELQVNGESLLDNTLYVSKKRVGINTLEPSHTFSIWDEEVEVAVNKISLNRAFIGSHRPVAVTLGANGKDNISLDIDGSVTINDLRLGALPLSTASNLPNWSGRAGEIVFNDSPALGQPIGWVCLGEHKWARFGIIQD